jgi:hypothetical protein
MNSPDFHEMDDNEPVDVEALETRLASGVVSVADIVSESLTAIQCRITDDHRAETKDWDEERCAIEGMCYSFINENPRIAGSTLPNDLFAAWQAILGAGGTPQIARTGHNGWQVCNVAATTPPRSTKTAGTAGIGNAHWPTPYSRRDPKSIPQRGFILGMHYLLGAVTLTAAAGGVGKSMLTLLDAVSFAIGRDLLLGTPLDRRYRVWVWNAEDDVDEMERRVAGICIHYGIDRADLDGWLYLDSGHDLPLDLAQGNGKTAVVREELIIAIAKRVRELGIEVVGLDPLVALHTMPEGDNSSLAKLIRTLNNKLAKPCGCAVDINHHTRKMAFGQDTMTVDDVRGAGTIVYSARSGRMLHAMSLTDAEKYSIEADDRINYFRLERAKANMAQRGTICWVHQIRIPIGNGPDGTFGDVVAVPTLWVPPDAMEGISDTVADAIRAEIAKGRYRRDARAGAAWAGRPIGRQLSFDTETKAGRQRSRTVLETLIKKGVLDVDIDYDKHRNAREYVVPGLEGIKK